MYLGQIGLDKIMVHHADLSVHNQDEWASLIRLVLNQEG